MDGAWPTAAAAIHLSLFDREDYTRPTVWLGIILVIAWAVLWLGLKLATGLIHLLVVVGLALVVWGLIKRGARAIT